MIESLEILAERLTNSSPTEVTVSDVIRLLLDSGLDANPITVGERAAFRSRKGKMAPVRKLSGLKASADAELSDLIQRRWREYPAFLRIAA